MKTVFIRQQKQGPYFLNSIAGMVEAAGPVTGFERFHGNQGATLGQASFLCFSVGARAEDWWETIMHQCTQNGIRRKKMGFFGVCVCTTADFI